jgi:hypothetical protein
MKTDPIHNAIFKLEHLAEVYRESPSSQNLINFIHYRTDYIQFVSFMWLNEITPSNTSWMLQCYLSVVTDELGVFDHGKSIPNDEFVKTIKDWRNHFGWLE